MDNENKNTFIGTVVAVFPTVNVSKKADKPFNKRIIVVDDNPDGDYKNPVAFEQIQDRCKYLDGYKNGDVVKVQFYLNGREWRDPKTGDLKYFTSNRIAYIEKVTEGETGTGADAVVDVEPSNEDMIDDMPF